ncbi:hypothetical protein ACFVWR_06890 [Leifsonia sp. NPDC058292]|uniref:hypothetical protein n=1 Tax=Leifsonia sp. NPDC058292 TaxID=3346428 RepID=UPI0036D79ED2
MNLLNRILGRKLDLPTDLVPAGTTHADLDAVRRYERLLRSSSPSAIEAVHVEAFERLTPAQLDLLFERFAADAGTDDEPPVDATPRSLARAAARSEKRRPGTLRRILGEPGDPLTQTLIGYSILDTVADVAITSALWAGFDNGAGFGGWFDGDLW